MFEILAVTNRLLCPPEKKSFLGQIEKIAASGVNGIILREKDLSPEDYQELAHDVAALCSVRNVRFIVHCLPQVAQNLHCPYVHFPWSVFEENQRQTSSLLFSAKSEGLLSFGVSVHSGEEAALALECGASWLIAGHVFTTQCKEGLEGRGLEFLAKLCKTSSVPVYGIGGIDEYNIGAVVKTGVAGACLMSSLMQSDDPSIVIEKLKYATHFPLHNLNT
jgi:thiamine-phosphate pyrophosphorylase